MLFSSCDILLYNAHLLPYPELCSNPVFFSDTISYPQMNLSIIIIMVKVKTRDNMIETFPDSLQWREKKLYITGWRFLLHFMVNRYLFSFCIERDSAWPRVLYHSSCFVYLMVLLAQNDCASVSGVNRAAYFMRMSSDCMSIVLSACTVNKQRATWVTL